MKRPEKKEKGRKGDRLRRQEDVLEVIVDCYVDTAEPIGSRCVSKKLGLSSATIRNVMQDLEEEGLIAQPHTSAGRVPTEKGYRYYVDGLMRVKALTEAQVRSIDAEYFHRQRSLNDILGKASHILSKITHCAGLVLLPRTKESHFKHIDLVPVSRTKILVFLVMGSGLTKDFVIDLDYPIDKSILEGVANFLNSTLYDMTLDEMKEHMSERIKAERDSSYKMIEEAMRIVNHMAANQAEERVYVEGASQMLAQPEFGDLHKMRAMLEFLEEKHSIVDLLSDETRDLRTRVHIGHENKARPLHGMSVVTRGFALRDSIVGRVGVIGPTRMDYNKVIPMVGFLAETLTKVLAEFDE